MEYNSTIFDIHICGACRKEYNDYQEFTEHKETCIVLKQLKAQRILSISHTVTSARVVPADQEFGDSRECTQIVEPTHVLQKPVKNQIYKKNQESSIVAQPLNTSMPSFMTNVTLAQSTLNAGEMVLPSSLLPPSGGINTEISQTVAVHNENAMPAQVFQKPRIHNEDVHGLYPSKPQQESGNIGNQITTPVGHEYARQNLEVDVKDRASEVNSSQPVCQIITMNNERFLIITNTGHGDICIPINADNAEVLTLLQSFMKDPSDLVLDTSPQKDASDAREIQFTSQHETELASQNDIPLLSSVTDIDSAKSDGLYSQTHLERTIPNIGIKSVYSEPQRNKTEGIQSTSQPTLQMQLDHNASFSLLPPSHVIPSIHPDSSHNSTHSQQHVAQDTLRMLSNETTAVNVTEADISINPALTTSDMGPLSISTDSLNLPKLTEMQLTPNTVLTSLGNLSKYANTDGSMESIGVGSLENVSKEVDGHVNDVIIEPTMQNLEMSGVVYMGDNSYSVHFKTPGNNNLVNNLTAETLSVDSHEQPVLSQFTEGMSSGQEVEGGVRIENQMMDNGPNVENSTEEGGVGVVCEDEVQESQVVEQLHQAYLRTQQQNKEKQLSQTPRAKTKQTTGRSPEGKQKHVRNKKFHCTIQDCSFVSAYMKDLERHMRVHTGERPYSCEYCNKTFSRMDKLRLHVRGHTGEKPFKCDLCNYRAVDNGSIKKHMAVHSGDKPIKCQTCSYACRTSSQLVVHLRKHTGDAPFSCMYCSSKFKIKSDMKRHMRTHTGEKPFKCEHCDFSCSAKSNLASHYNVHHSNTKQTCEHCDFSTSSKRSFYEHQKLHSTPDPENICKVCQYVCSNKQTLKTHMANAHDYKLYVCKECNFCSKSMTKAWHHYSTCGSGKRSSSSHHKKSRKRRSSRDEDSQGRKYEKNYVCDICGEAFVRKDSLTSHVKLHRERTQSTLSTALTVLELQQPVINSTAVPPGGDHNYDMEVVTISPSLGQKKGDHSYESFEKEVVKASSRFENQRSESISENRRSRGRSSGKSYRNEFVYESSHKRKSSRSSRSQTATLENFEKCKPTTSAALRSSKNLEPSRFEQYESHQTASGHEERQSQHIATRVPEVLPSLVVNVNQTDPQVQTSSQAGAGDVAVVIKPGSAPQTQNPNIQVVQNITVPVIQLNNGQLVAMQPVGNGTDQLFSLTPLAINQLIPGQESTGENVASSSKPPTEGMVQMFSASTNSYISVLQQSLPQQNTTQSSEPNSLPVSYTNPGLPVQNQSSNIQCSGDNIHQQPFIVTVTKPHPPQSELSSALPTSKKSSVTGLTLPPPDPPPYKHKVKSSKRNSLSHGLDDSSSQIDVQSIELDDTSYDFNLQDSGLVSKETMEGSRQSDL